MTSTEPSEEKVCEMLGLEGGGEELSGKLHW